MEMYRLIKIDIKIMVAYSSVVGINFATCSSFSLLKTRIIRRVLVIIFHGLCSAGLFYIAKLYTFT